LLADAPLIEPIRHRDAQHHHNELEGIANDEVGRGTKTVSQGTPVSWVIGSRHGDSVE